MSVFGRVIVIPGKGRSAEGGEPDDPGPSPQYDISTSLRIHRLGPGSAERLKSFLVRGDSKDCRVVQAAR